METEDSQNIEPPNTTERANQNPGSPIDRAAGHGEYSCLDPAHTIPALGIHKLAGCRRKYSISCIPTKSYALSVLIKLAGGGTRVKIPMLYRGRYVA
jgi:hypothetical protein